MSVVIVCPVSRTSGVLYGWCPRVHGVGLGPGWFVRKEGCLVRTALVPCYCVCTMLLRLCGVTAFVPPPWAVRVCFCGLFLRGLLRGLSLFLLFRFLFPGLSVLEGLFHYPPDLLLMMAITGIFLMGACVLAFAACLVLLTRWIAHRAGMPADEVAVLVTAAVCVLILLGVAMSPVFR